MTHAWGRTILAILAIALGCGAYAADKKGDSKLSGGDRNFITEAAEAGHAEVELGKIAQQNGASQAVKDFAARMVADHGKANQELASIAKGLGVTPPMQPGSKHQADAKKMMKLKGADFDREYAEHMVKDHEKTVSLFEKQSKNGDAGELKAFASKTLPTLQEHLKMAQDLKKQTDQKKK
jgi:putative membrane protein